MADLPQPQSWSEVKDLAVEALESNLDFLRRSRPGSPLTEGPQRLDLDDKGRLICDAVPTRVNWSEQQYFLVGAGQDPQHVGNRLPIEFHWYTGQRVFFTVPESTREALGKIDYGPVRLYLVDDTDAQLKTRLLKALERTAHGPLVHQLWQGSSGGEVTPRQPAAGGLNPGQQRAFAAMTTPGSYFVWGPPGTGKTKVISSAVADAVESGRTVLVASHTHVAVDNVLEKLADRPFPIGTLIRIAGAASRNSVSRDVIGKGTLLLDQAAAHLTDHQERLREIERKEDDLVRAREQVTEQVTRLNAELTGVDHAAVDRAEAAVVAGAEIAGLSAQLGQVHDEVVRLRYELERSQAELDELLRLDPGSDAPARGRLDEQLAAARATASQAQAALADHDARLAELEATGERLRKALRLARAEEARTGALARVLGAGARRARRVAELAEQLNETEVDVVASSRARTGVHTVLRAAQEQMVAARQELDRLDAAARRQAAARSRVVVARRRLQDATGAQRELAARLARQERLATDAPAARRLLARVAAEGLRDKLSQRDEENAELAELQEAAQGLRTDRQRVEDDFITKQRELVRTAPVIACTLTALANDRLLAQRAFDVVILDEVANANASAVVYAAARATGTVALVGDFLQNAPIAETDDPVGEGGQASVAWQRDDVFALAEITDRASALAHERCVALSRQYRYPSIIADIVNEFCYEGQLESEHPSKEADGPTVTFIDASDVEGYELRNDGQSWWSPGGIELMVAIARHHGGREQRDGSPLGFVTPYAPQKRRAERRAQAEGLSVLCGTSHTFQGKEVPILVFDLMQDRQDRWVGVADLHGGRRAVSAAKLLNVAITRMQERIYLVGDWRYVRSSERPGMQALAAQAGKPNFRLLSGREVLSGDAPLG